ncbi:MAG: aldo/keto reductase [Oscillospiraceae bacterium]|nr:aldo/keto reductase [Oscillospiraceae bacterium]
MKYRTDKKSGKELSVLGFGCLRFPKSLGTIDQKKTTELVANAVRQGVNYFDTAHTYPGSEAALGEALSTLGIRDKVYIATKLPGYNCRKSEDFDRIFSQQLERLKTDRIDYYLLHNMNSFAQYERLRELGIEQWFERKREEGSIEKIGFSFHGPYTEFEKLLNARDWDMCQIQYNYSDENYQAGRRGLELAQSRGISVVIMEPLLGGRLAAGLPKQAEAAFKRADSSLSCAAWGLRWLTDQPGVTVILSGMNDMAQLEDNIKTVDTYEEGNLSDEDKAVYDEVNACFKKSYKVHCTGCAYCMPCPRGVNIPGTFAAYNASYAMGMYMGLKQYVLSTGAHASADHLASLCVGCGKCAKHCPQNIEIPKVLKAAKKRLEIPGFGIALKGVRAVLSLRSRGKN